MPGADAPSWQVYQLMAELWHNSGGRHLHQQILPAAGITGASCLGCKRTSCFFVESQD